MSHVPESAPRPTGPCPVAKATRRKQIAELEKSVEARDGEGLKAVEEIAKLLDDAAGAARQVFPDTTICAKCKHQFITPP